MQADAGSRRKNLVRAVVASTVGTSIEWYDFLGYGTLAALVFPKLFFPKSDPYVGALEAFATFFVGFAARPVGAALFGHYGDRIGRKATLIATLLLMGLATFLIGVLPTYAVLGPSAAFILTALRVCQGLGVGGEWGGSAVLSLEWGSNRRRGFITSWPQFGGPMGLLLSTGVIAALLGIAPGDAFFAWGWRVFFLLSIVLVGIGLWIRLRILETPVFRELLNAQRIERQPLVEVFRRNWKEIILTALLRLPEQAPFYVFTTFILTYGVQTLKFPRPFLVNAVVVGAAVSLFAVPFWGFVSDRVGRKRIYLIGVAAMGVFGFVYIGLLNTGIAAVVFLAIVLSLVPHDIQYGPQGALIAESYTGRLRYSGSSVGYQLASVVAGGPAPLIAVFLIATFHNGYAVSIYILVCAIIGFVATVLLPDRSRLDHTREYEEQEGPASAALQPST
jgi:MFS family permease